MINYIQRENSKEDSTLWKFRRIVAHQGPFNHRHNDYKNSLYNVCIEWGNGDKTYECLAKAIVDDPIMLAMYAKDNNLLDTPGWKSLKPHMQEEKRSLSALSSKSSYGHSGHHPSINADFKSPRTTEKHVTLMNVMATTS